MIVSDALFSRQSMQGLGKLGAEIAGLQERVSSGVNDPRPSADPRRASELSALRDLRAQLDQRDNTGRNAADRLSMTDQTLGSATDTLRRFSEITLRAANDVLTPDAVAALRAEALTLRDTVQNAANATDMQGRPLFAGTAPGPAYVKQAQGGMVYQGNDAQSMAVLGENHQIATGLAGSRVFQAGSRDIFTMLDDTIAALSPSQLSARTQVAATGVAQLDLTRSRAGDPISFTLTGPAGSAQIDLDLRLDAPEAAVTAINAASGRTGITAVLADNGTSLRLMSAGQIALSDQKGGPRDQPVVRLGQIDDQGHSMGAITGLRRADLGINALVADARAAVDHLATMRAEAGSLAAAVDTRREAMAAQRLTLDQSIAQIGDLDVAATLTRLQTLLTTQEAAQMTFVKIVGQSLFNYLR
jgi:flagellar hook-associated protein 3 FlgL